MISFIQSNEKYLTAEMFLHINYGYRFCQWLTTRLPGFRQLNAYLPG